MKRILTMRLEGPHFKFGTLGLGFVPSQLPFSSSFIIQKTEHCRILRMCLVTETVSYNCINGPPSLISIWGRLGTPTGILSLFSDHTPAKVQHLRRPFEVQSPSEPLNWGQGGQRQIWLPQQLETGSVWEVSGDRLPSREMMLKRQWRLRICLSKPFPLYLFWTGLSFFYIIDCSSNQYNLSPLIYPHIFQLPLCYNLLKTQNVNLTNIQTILRRLSDVKMCSAEFWICCISHSCFLFLSCYHENNVHVQYLHGYNLSTAYLQYISNMHW